MGNDAASDEAGRRCIVIPARFASTRYPGKPLITLRGASGRKRTLIEWTWRSAMAVPSVDHVVVATDDERIADEVRRFGGNVVMTPSTCVNGTERCAAALDSLPSNVSLVVNLQGDNPLTPPTVVADLLERMRDPAIAVSTPAILSKGGTRAHLLEEQRAGRVGGTTVVPNCSHDALYFSKAILPHGAEVDPCVPIYLHLGVYAYRPEALRAYRAADQSYAERTEGLEQLRFLDQGIRVSLVVCPTPDGTIAELNNPADREVIEAELIRRGME